MSSNKNKMNPKSDDNSNIVKDRIFAISLMKKELKQLEMECEQEIKDTKLAQKLQKELDEEVKSEQQLKQKNFDIAVVDNSLELLDPTPDLMELFISLDKKYFDGLLNTNKVKVKWTQKMYLYTGVTYDAPVEIRLSAKLLSMRTRKELIETLLHEMIHAFLFLNNIFEDEDRGHGFHFLTVMNEINAKANTNIKVFHEFNAEVHYYKNKFRKNKYNIKSIEQQIKDEDINNNINEEKIVSKKEDEDMKRIEELDNLSISELIIYTNLRLNFF